LQAIALMDTLDKDLNTFAMRVREWYGWHFPELARIVKDNFVYARVAQAVGDRAALREEAVPALQELLSAGDDDAEATARAIFEAAKSSMGMDIREEDLANIDAFTGALAACAFFFFFPSRGRGGSCLDARAPPLGPPLSLQAGWCRWASTGSTCRRTWRARWAWWRPTWARSSATRWRRG
jgi:hypothetical protein